MRGEHVTRWRKIKPAIGSSPRARGTPGSRSPSESRCRFIPACAGNTLPERAWSCRGSVHPRVRGEHTDAGLVRTDNDGSSPRARGTHDAFEFGTHSSRFIPACAGNTRRLRVRDAQQPVHPRVRGEHSHKTDFSVETPGSSPRARGTPGGAHGHLSGERFIPACAGNT